ncbi:tail protein X [Campylobacter showae]|jgi:phage tail protein X|uniref:tail protein X n=1 Tax=Campylobacter showae TaxID=204 RepID=UPI0020678B01|nr:tail protein X [Campylobacter showae]DAT69281.1 MAG TPA: tail protein [Caudoviricetes sp.]DAX78122.1 MAG TPA: tail protein [Caudoviricetes sp.]
MKYLAKDGDTLDMICYKHYKSLNDSVYSQFLRANEHLLGKEKLSGGDIVNLPDIEVKAAVKVTYLWD